MLKRWQSDRRRFIAGLAMALFALRALVPVGFMLSFEPAQAAITLCPEFGPLPFSVGAHHHHVHGTGASSSLQLPDADSHSPCPFAAAGHSAWHAAALENDLASGADRAPTRVRAAGITFPRTHHEFSHAPRGPPFLNPA
jgi:hypothetical protein